MLHDMTASYAHIGQACNHITVLCIALTLEYCVKNVLLKPTSTLSIAEPYTLRYAFMRRMITCYAGLKTESTSVQHSLISAEAVSILYSKAH